MGENSLVPYLDQINLFPFGEGNYRLLPMRGAAIIGAALTLFFAGVIAGVYVDDLLLKQLFDRVFDLNFIRARTDAEDVLILLLAHQRRFFGQRRRLNDLVWLVHLILSPSCSSALCVTRIFSNPSSCSVLTSAAVASFTGLTLRADL